MSARYVAVGWNRQKRLYDAWIVGSIAAYLAVFIAGGALLLREPTLETLLIRGLGAAGFVLLHVVLAIGPLARLNPRFAPLLYNRRHLGVATFLVALAHAALSLVQFHALGDANPIASLLTANQRIDSLAQFPFEWLGAGALVILFLMAATSHDFWLATLSPRAWKALHMLVYAAYAMLVMHVALGALQSETHPVYAALLLAGAAGLAALHLLAARREARADRPPSSPAPDADGYLDACAVADILPDRAKVVCLGGERIAVFRHGEGGAKVSAVTNLCAHQQGPLGEGRVIDGCITCPWHGHQYLPESGQSPPPFTERIATYNVRVRAGRVLVDPRPNAPGTPVPPASAEHAAP